MKKRVRVYNWNSVLTNVIEGLRKLGHDVEEQAASFLRLFGVSL